MSNHYCFLFLFYLYIYLKIYEEEHYSIIKLRMSFEDNLVKSQSSDLNNSMQPTSITASNSYHESACGAILLPLPRNSPSEIFSYLRHRRFDQFRRCLDVYHKEIIQMKNEHGQVNLLLSFIFIFLY